MARLLLWIALALAVLAALFGAGCMLVTGSTDGYVASTCGCQPGQVCCASFDGGSLMACQDQACSASYLQLCTSNAECGNGGACITETCTYEDAGFTVQACGLGPICTLADN